MLNLPFIKCLNPKRVFNKYTGKFVIASCGKCEHCRLKSSMQRKTRCEMEAASHKFTFFITLTFANEHLNFIQLIPKDELEPNTYNIVNCQTSEIVGEYTEEKPLEIYSLQKKTNTLGMDGIYLPVFNKHQVQKFIKNIRKAFSYERIRLFYCGELGPIHLRPHYHFSLWCNRDETAQKMYEIVTKYWPYGRVDVSLSRGQSLSYVASYINSNQFVPRIYALSKQTPFTHHSRYLGESVVKSENETLADSDPIRFSQRRLRFDGFNRNIFLWRSCKNRFFPQCKGYASKSCREREYAYRLNEIVSSWTRETKTITNARFITDFVRYNDFYHEIPILNELLQYFRKSTMVYTLIPKNSRANRENPNPNDWQVAEDYPKIIDWDKFERQVYMELRTSEHFRKLCNYDPNLYHKKVLEIQNFYNTLELHLLNVQIKSVQDYFKEHQLKWNNMDNKLFFENTLSIKYLQRNKEYKQHFAYKKLLAKNFVKHKELNDLNNLLYG